MMYPPETLEDTIAHFEEMGKNMARMDRFCVTAEAHESHVKQVTWMMRIVDWLKELQDRRNKENEL